MSLICYLLNNEQLSVGHFAEDMWKVLVYYSCRLELVVHSVRVPR